MVAAVAILFYSKTEGEDKKDEPKTNTKTEVVAAVTEEGHDEATMMTSVTEKNEHTDFSGSTLASTNQRKDVFLQIVTMILHGNEGTTLKTYGLLDACSMSTLIREEVANKLKLSRRNKEVNLGTVNKTDALVVPEVSLQVSPKDGSRMFDVQSAYVRPSDRFNMPAKPNFTDNVDAYKHLDGIEFDAVSPSDISILIGANVPDAVLMKGFRFGSKNQPLAVDTPFGWTLFGPSLTKKVPSPVVSESINLALQSLWEEEVKAPTEYVNLLTSDVDQNLQASVERFWKQEHIGILPEKDTARSQEDLEDMEKLEKETILLDNGKYQVPMLWCSEDAPLPNNRVMALKRYSLLDKRLRREILMYHSMESMFCSRQTYAK